MRARILRHFLFICFLGAARAASADSLRDVKGPVAFPVDTIPFLIVLALGIVAAAAYFIFRRRHKTKAPAPSLERVKTAWEKAYERLEALAQSGLLEKGDFPVYYVKLSDIIRRYMEDRFRIRAPEMTTEEFLNSLKGSAALTAHQADVLQEFLSPCDMVKFAKHLPQTEEARKNTRLARRIVDETRAHDTVL